MTLLHLRICLGASEKNRKALKPVNPWAVGQTTCE